MKKLRVLIVDDEPLARERLRTLLSGENSVEIVGECVSGPDAIATIRRTPPDLLFLDVQMPGCDGLQVLKELPMDNRPAVVFVTAHERFAISAFEVQAVDYLLKPFDCERLQTALRRTQDYFLARRPGNPESKPETPPPSNAAPTRTPERLTVRTDGRIVFLKPDEIVWVEAADNYVILHLAEGRLIVRETLTALEDRLGPMNFARVNRSALVHLDQIRELQPALHGDYTVVLRNGVKIPLSRNLRGRLGNFAGGGPG